MRKVKENRNCPYCLSPVEPDEERVRCPKCGVVHHADCWKANGSCSVYGCDGWAVWSSQIADRVAPAAGEAIEVMKSDAQSATSDSLPRCIKCGTPVKQDQLLCFRCRHATGDAHYMENCFGPAVLMLAGAATVITLIAKAVM